jgi:hypothetical protein
LLVLGTAAADHRYPVQYTRREGQLMDTGAADATGALYADAGAADGHGGS